MANWNVPVESYYSVALLPVLYLLIKTVFLRPTTSKLPLPPGPKGLPLIGNVGDLPPKGGLEWQYWLKHKDLYGPISSVTVFGQTIILVHDLEVALELLDKRGAKYSSRPRMVFAGEMYVPTHRIVLSHSHPLPRFPLPLCRTGQRREKREWDELNHDVCG